MRFIYLDESGLSNPSHEPFVVVAGVITHADKQWKTLEARLSGIADKHVTSGRRENFVFHAMHLYSGGGDFPREEYDKETRWKILDELIGVVCEFELPVVAGWANRGNSARANSHQPGSAEANKQANAIAYIQCVVLGERWMRESAEDGEIASVIVENNDHMRTTILDAHGFVRDIGKLGLGWISSNIGFERIVERPKFEIKSEASLLQLADLSAFVIKKRLVLGGQIDRFYAPMAHLIVGGDVDPRATWP